MKSGDFNAAAKAAGLEVKTTDFIARGAPIGDVGVSPAVDAVAFALQPAASATRSSTDNGDRDRQGARAPGSAAVGHGNRQGDAEDRALNERRNRFYASYMTKARERMKVNINRELIAQLVA